MRTKSLTMVVALLLMAGGAAAQDGATPAAQPAVEKPPGSSLNEFLLVNQIDIGVRGTSFGSNSDPARYQRYRDVRDGGTVDRFRLFKDTERLPVHRCRPTTSAIAISASRAATRTSARSRRRSSGTRFRCSTARTPERCTTCRHPGTLTLNDSIQSGIQNKTLTLASALGGSSVVRSPHATRHRERATSSTARRRTSISTFNLRNTKKRARTPGAAASASATRSRPRCRCRSITARPNSATSLEYVERSRLRASGLRRVVLPEQRDNAGLGQPGARDRRRRRRAGARADGALAEHRHEHRERGGWLEAARATAGPRRISRSAACRTTRRCCRTRSTARSCRRRSTVRPPTSRRG